MSDDLVKHIETWILHADTTSKTWRGDLRDNIVRDVSSVLEALTAELAQVRAERDGAYERAAEVADDHATRAWDIANAEGQNSVCASGRNHGARAIAAAIRQMKGHQHD